MKKITRTRLAFSTTTIRQLDAAQLGAVAGGNSKAPTQPSARDQGCGYVGQSWGCDGPMTGNCDVC